MKRRDISDLEDRYGFQIRMCERFGNPILNVACQEDPAHLGEKFNAINIDLRTTDLHLEDVDYARDLKNFHNMDARNLTTKIAWTGIFSTVVLGEFLEHCTEEYALETLKGCVSVTKPGGVIVFTFPFDHRKPEEQHEPEKLLEPVPGYCTYHRTIWTDRMLERLLLAAGLKEIMRADLDYFFGRPLKGLGLVARKPAL